MNASAVKHYHEMVGEFAAILPGSRVPVWSRSGIEGIESRMAFRKRPTTKVISSLHWGHSDPDLNLHRDRLFNTARLV